MALLSMHGVSLSFGGELLLDKVDLHIEPGDRACLVGRNGAGKSSLLKLLHGDMAPDEGAIHCRRGLRVGYLPQTVPPDLEGRVAHIVESGLRRFARTIRARTDAQQAVGTVLSHLTLDPAADFRLLSGGQKRRVLLGRALVCSPDLLLLDEPTNHLDIDSICWMEEYLLRHCQTFLFVTHDRALLRRLATRIIDLDRGHIADWPCDYDTFLRRKADLLHDESVRNARFDRKLAQEEIWIRQGVKERRTRNEGRVRALMRMREERRARRDLEGSARLRAQQAAPSGAKVIETKDAVFAYGDTTPIIGGLNLRIMRGDRVGIIGPNGSGKTTLLRLFTGELTPCRGTLSRGARLEMAYFDQHRAVLDDNATVVDSIGAGKEYVSIAGKSRHVFGYLQDFLFTPDRARAPVHALSGGERNRLLLARLFAKPSNLIIMDEPTNDLDTETLELLEEQLLNYGGTVVVVSHDRAFLNNVVTSLLVMEGGGRIVEYIGSYDDWLETSRAQAPDEPRQAKPRAAERARKPNPFGFKQKRELEALPKKIEALEAEQVRLHDLMAAPGYFRTPPDRIAADKQRTAGLAREIETLYDRWQELDALRESNGTQGLRR
ncbi:MAG: ATP-binding cassette domain-containing protein [Kiritimatiellae bacterium]|nr:ATP-binding cassette domain-containing protein [Kiritimatiellia bacterium]